MKLSPDKVEQLSAALVDELMVEEELDAEIHKLLQAYKYEITMGRMNYDELFKKTKQKLVRDRKIVL